MNNLIEIRRVTVVADVVLETMLLEEFTGLGAKGYTCMDCHGKGRHNVVEGVDPFTAALVRIELLVQPDVAQKIIDYLRRAVFTSYACTACVETVEVASSHTF
jgi:nitrogen regulatory protein P-II